MYCSCNGKSRTTTTRTGARQETCSVCGREKSVNPYQLDGIDITLGDKLWCLSRGWVEIHKLQSLYIYAEGSAGVKLVYRLDGTQSWNTSKIRTLYWDKVVITPPPPPKKKVAVYRWVMMGKARFLFITSDYYPDEKSIKHDRQNYKVVQRIDSTKKMVDEG